MGDIVGRLFREFAVTLAVTILVSAVVSLTLTPMMCAKLLRHTPDEARRARCTAASERFFDATIRALRNGRCAGCSGTRRRRCWSPSRTLVGDDRSSTSIVPKGFFPVQDTGVILGISAGAADGVVRRHGAAAAGAGGGDPAGPGGGEPVVVHRRRRHQHHAQQRAHPDQPEAARGAPRRAPPTSSAACSRSWRQVEGIDALPAAGAGPDGRGPGQPDAVPVHASRTPTRRSCAAGRRRLVDELQRLPELRDVASDQQDGGLAARARRSTATPPRGWASRRR